MDTTAGLMKRRLVYVEPKATVTQAARAMKKGMTGSVLVGRAPRPVGIFTERDLVRKVVAAGLNPAKTRVCEVMSKALVTVDCAEPLGSVFESLAKGRFRHLPITDKGAVVGIISLTDLAGIFREMAEEDRFLKEF